MLLLSTIVGILSYASVCASYDPEKILQDYIKSISASSGTLCTTNTCCNITSSTNCDLSVMKRDESMIVLPGGDTRCIFSTSTPFAFQVIPGDADKLLYYFQGGGACWDQASTRAGLCTTDCVPQKLIGVFDRDNAKNPYRDYTVVHLMYCSGDIWGGNVTRDYNDSAGVPVIQKGLANGQAVLDWTLRQQELGFLAPSLSSVVVMGCSAGSIGAQLWSNQLVTQLAANRVAIIPDSYAGLFPDGTQGPLVYEYGFCSSGFILTDELLTKCNNQQLTLQDLNSEFFAADGAVPYAFIQSKTDNIQISFYESVARSFGIIPAKITPEDFYTGVNSIFEGYNVYKNFVTYLVDGSQHCFTPYDNFYTADAVGADDSGADGTYEMMYEWSAKMPLDHKESIDTVCEGDIEENGQTSSGDITYCDIELVPKEFTEL